MHIENLLGKKCTDELLSSYGLEKVFTRISKTKSKIECEDKTRCYYILTHNGIIRGVVVGGVKLIGEDVWNGF